MVTCILNPVNLGNPGNLIKKNLPDFAAAAGRLRRPAEVVHP